MSIFRADVLQGKTAFVTGGGSGINLAIATCFAQHGAAVALMGRTLEKTRAAAEVLSLAGARALGLSGDVRDAAALGVAFEAAVAAFGPIDFIVCGAAGNFPAPALAMSPNAFKSVVDIDLLGSFNTCRVGFEHLRKPGASVLMISAMQSLLPTALQSHVCAAKAGVDMLMKSLAIEWGPLGVRVNSIAPGPVGDTEGFRRLAPAGSGIAEKLASTLPLRRIAGADEIAELALFLVSDAARNITGAVVTNDAGATLIGSGAMMSTSM